MRRGVKLGIGIPLTLIGLFMTIGGVAILAWVGLDGSFSLPSTRAVGDGNALVFDEIALDPSFPTSGDLSTTLEVTVDGRGKDVFLGIGRTDFVAKYLDGVPIDRIVQINWPGGVRTEHVDGTATPEDPPAHKKFWKASDEGPQASIRWTLQGGDWTLVIMNADASAGVDVTGSGSVTLPLLGPIGAAILAVGLIALVAGVLLTISGAKTPKTARVAAAPVSAQPPDTPGAGAGQPPPRPDEG
jgi:hypothetical protein